jgi:hypothetical protein
VNNKDSKLDGRRKDLGSDQAMFTPGVVLGTSLKQDGIAGMGVIIANYKFQGIIL